MVDRGFDVSPDESRLAYVDVHQGQIDIWRSGIHGEAPEQVTNDVAEDSTPVWQTDSRRIIFSSERNGIVQVFNYSMNGELEQVTFGNSDSYVSDVSRDGTKVLLVDTKDDADIWRADIDGKQTLQITSDLGAEFWPDVSPNGEAMIYQSSRKMDGASIRKSTIWLRKPIATGVSSQIALAGFEPRFSTDGNRVAYLRSEAEGHSLWVTSTAGGDAHTVTGEGIQIAGFSMSPFSNVVVQDYQWTPSGRTLVYCARRGGLSNVWQVAADGSGEKQLSQNDKPELLFFGPSVSPDGSRLAWLSRSMDIHRRNWCLWGTIDGRTSKLYETDRSMAIAGWSADSRNLILKFTDIAEREIRKPSTLELAYFVFEAGNLVKIGEFNNIYFQSVVASADGSLIGFIERSDDHDAIRCISLSDLKSKMVTSSDEPRVYLNNLLIGPDDRSVFYGKQSRWQIISIIKNFE
jgi:Tol biopolymer transport system component